MKIGIDVRTLETGHRFRGIGAYSAELLNAISRIDHKNHYVFFTQNLPSRASEIINRADFSFEDYLIRKVPDSGRYYFLKDQYFFPKAIKNSKVELVHILDQLSCPLIKSGKTVVTVHDLIQLMAIGNPDWKTKLKFSAVKYADKIIAISDSVKKDLINLVQIPERKIKVIYNGYESDFFKPSSDSNQSAIFTKDLLKGKAEKYLLYVGSFAQHEPRKNLDFLIDVFERLILSGVTDSALVLIGKSGAEAERLKKLCEDKKISDKVIFLDYIPNSKLGPYFQSAEMFLFPSLYEGFGLPPLQAMACATPVISADTSSLPEVIGKGGILLSPDKIDPWVAAIKNIVNDSNLKQDLIKKGLEQAKKFSWEKCAQEVIETYQEVATQNV